MIFEKKIESIYRARLFARHDDTGRVKYFSPEEFEGLAWEPYTFVTKVGHTLAGAFYTCPETLRQGMQARLVVFAHGLGGGHTSYMQEIVLLARRGYRVFAYDNTGCMASDGEGSRGLGASLSDLDDCLAALKADPAVDTSDITVVGHSWGGYAAMNITAYHPDVKRIVGFAGFVSVETMVRQSFPSLLGVYRGGIMKLERDTNGDYAEQNATETLAATDAKVLLFHSRDDGTVSYKKNFGVMQARLGERENITFVTCDKKGHNPNYTTDAVAYKEELYAALKKLPAVMTEDECEAFRTSFNWERMTAQDRDVWEKIYTHIEQ